MLKRKKLSYSAKKYSNPFFNGKRSVKRYSRVKSSLDWKRKSAFILFPLVIIGFFVFYFFSSIFNLKHVNISGNQRAETSELEKIVWDQCGNKRLWLGSQKNINLFDGDQLSNKLTNLYYFEKLEIDKDLPGTININVEERKYSLIWLEADKYYYIDGNGNIFSEADPLEIKQEVYPLVENLRGTNSDGISVGIGSETISYILNLFSLFKEKYSDMKIDRFIVDSDANAVKIKILNSPSIYFDSTKSADEQIDKLMIIIKEKLKNDFVNKQYIDLRYGDRIYYK